VNLSHRILDADLAYTGTELRSGFVHEHTGVVGDAALVFFGPCYVPTEHLVDLDDARAGEHIRAARMAHVIVEHPHCALALGVLRQRLLVAILGETLAAHGVHVRRDGDDLYFDTRKLTVSIAAPAPAACVIHLGVNIDPAGAPVPAVGLEELGVDARAVLDETLHRYRDELSTAAHAETKVRAVP